MCAWFFSLPKLMKIVQMRDRESRARRARWRASDCGVAFGGVVVVVELDDDDVGSPMRHGAFQRKKRVARAWWVERTSGARVMST